MTVNSSYQPFLIGQGTSRTGLYTYLESWVKPEDAYDELRNAYIYRGNLLQRNGMILYPSIAGAGGLVYIDGLKVGENVLGLAVSFYSSDTSGNGVDFPKLPIIPGTVIIRTLTSAGVEKWIDNGSGVLTGSLGDTGTVDYTTGIWTITLGGGRTIANNIEIWGEWGYVPTHITTGTQLFRPIMGIKQFTSPTTGRSITIIMDTRRASYYDQATSTFVGLNQFTQVIWEQFAAAVTTGPIQTQWANLTPFSVVITTFLNNALIDTTTDDGVGNIIPSGNISGGTVIYASGVITITFTGAPAITTQVIVTADVTGDYFTGNNSNFFNATNWRYNDVQGDFLYMTNNVDPVTLFNGTQLSRPLFNTTLASVQGFLSVNNDTIKTTLDVKVYKNRLLFLRPTLLGAAFPEAQTIRFSQQQQATVVPSVVFSSYNFASDVPGNGGFVNAPTGDWIMASQLIKDTLIVFSTNSSWAFVFTSSTFDPYRFQQVNSTRATNAPYGSIPYDIRATSMGAKGLIFCDGVSTDRYDINIIDIFEEINETGFAQCFGQKDDNLNQGWMLFPSESNTLLTNDGALIYNYLEDTWAIFYPSMGTLVIDPNSINALSCLGLGLNSTDLKWSDFAPGGFFGTLGQDWSQANFPWIGFLSQTLSPVLLGGDQNGFVYQMNTGVTDNGNAVQTFVRTKRMNPFIQQGMKARFGYLDVYYEINKEINLSFNFFLNSSHLISKIVQITLDGPEGSIWAWKRIYLNMVGQFIQIGITNQNPEGSVEEFDTGGTFNILGMILHAAPAGRLTPGQFI